MLTSLLIMESDNLTYVPTLHFLPRKMHRSVSAGNAIHYMEDLWTTKYHYLKKSRLKNATVCLCGQGLACGDAILLEGFLSPLCNFHSLNNNFR